MEASALHNFQRLLDGEEPQGEIPEWLTVFYRQARSELTTRGGYWSAPVPETEMDAARFRDFATCIESSLRRTLGEMEIEVERWKRWKIEEEDGKARRRAKLLAQKRQRDALRKNWDIWECVGRMQLKNPSKFVELVARDLVHEGGNEQRSERWCYNRYRQALASYGFNANRRMRSNKWGKVLKDRIREVLSVVQEDGAESEAEELRRRWRSMLMQVRSATQWSCTLRLQLIKRGIDLDDALLYLRRALVAEFHAKTFPRDSDASGDDSNGLGRHRIAITSHTLAGCMWISHNAAWIPVPFRGMAATAAMEPHKECDL